MIDYGIKNYRVLVKFTYTDNIMNINISLVKNMNIMLMNYFR